MNALLLLLAAPWFLCAAAMPGFFRNVVDLGREQALPSQASQSAAFGRR